MAPHAPFSRKLVSEAARIWSSSDGGVETWWASLLSLALPPPGGATPPALPRLLESNGTTIPFLFRTTNAPAGLLMTITVQGTIPRDQLCPTPDFTLGVHMEGVCQVIVYGTSPSDSAVSCCPNMISQPIVPGDAFVPSAPVCQAELDQSPHRLSLYSVSTPYSQVGAGPEPLDGHMSH